MTYFFNITPVAKPRMTQSDKWKKRDCVQRYWDYKNQLKVETLQQKFVMPEANYRLIFYLPMPKSWSRGKQLKMNGLPHKQVPDKDNLEKGFLDALCISDAHIWDGRVTKYWGYEGGIRVECE